jgi:predicted TIM-barrel fold metal-dependent hydrolase
MTVIDCQSHVFPPAYADLLTRCRGPLLQTVAVGTEYHLDYFSPGGEQLQRFRLNPADYSVARKLVDMDRAGIDVSVISVNIPTPDLVGPEWSGEAAMLCNDEMATLCAAEPSRLVGLAVLPLPAVSAAIAELDRSLDQLGLRGVFMPSHIAGMPLDDPTLEPFYAYVAARGVPLVLHPSVPLWGSVLHDYAMIPMLGFMVETSIALLRLILGGVLERHPNLIVVHPHAGGVLPYLMGRIEEQTEVKRRGRDHITQPPGMTYRHVYLDLVSPDVAALRYAYAFSGPQRLLFGSDHPWVSMDAILDRVRACGWPAGDLTQILAGNAARIFRI